MLLKGANFWEYLLRIDEAIPCTKGSMLFISIFLFPTFFIVIGCYTRAVWRTVAFLLGIQAISLYNMKEQRRLGRLPILILENVQADTCE
jgi:hypothetical protein